MRYVWYLETTTQDDNTFELYSSKQKMMFAYNNIMGEYIEDDQVQINKTGIYGVSVLDGDELIIALQYGKKYIR